MTLLRRGVLPVLLATVLVAPPARAEWATNGIPICTATNDQREPVLCPDGTGGVIAAWLDDRTGYNTDIFAQRVLPTGVIAPRWPAGGVGLTHVTCWKHDPAITADGAGGAIVVWADDRCRDTTSYNIYAQRVGSDGAVDPSWPTDGLAVCNEPGGQRRPAIVSDGAGGAIIFWDDDRAGGVPEIYATRVLVSGALAPGWPDGGLRLSSGAQDLFGPRAVPDGAGGAIVTWEDWRSGNADIYAQRVDSTGAVHAGWPADGLALCGLPTQQRKPCIATDGGGGALVAWFDLRAPGGDIYANRVTGSGTLAPDWSEDGDPVCTAAGIQQSPVMVGDGDGGAVIVWTDRRTPGNGYDLYAQRLAADGEVFEGWPENGTALCTAPGDQTAPVATADGAAGTLVAWVDARDLATTGQDVYVQHVTSAGALAPGWPQQGFPVCRSPGNQSGTVIGPDGSGGAFIAWTDPRTTPNGSDIYLSRFAGVGPMPTQVRNLAALHHDGQTFLTWTAPGPTGWTYRVYASSEPITSRADLDGATFIGSIGDSTWCDRRLTAIKDSLYGFCTDSLATPLESTQALFVRTTAADGLVHYAATAQPGLLEEDRDIVPGINALMEPVGEIVSPPRPVYQRTMADGPFPTEVYTLWASPVETPLFPAMANRYGQAYDCGVGRAAPAAQSSLMVRFHIRSGSFLGVMFGSNEPGEWILALDDPRVSPLQTDSFWFGYHEGYDTIAGSTTPPVSGIVYDYTMRRVGYSVEWALRTFPVDRTRVITYGYSMGGVGAAMLAFQRPDLIAGALAVIGSYDFTVADDPNPWCLWNTGNQLRVEADRLWGTLETNLPSSLGLPIYDVLDHGVTASRIEPQAVPPILGFNGKNDRILGWAQAVGFYQAMERARQGGIFFFDSRCHGGCEEAWVPMQEPRYLYRFRTNRSFPGLSHCSADHDPGDGTSTSGDSIGTLNGFVEWDTTLVDRPEWWQTTLRLRNLTSKWGTVYAPESLTVDVTPRRTQQFHAQGGLACLYRVVRLSDNTVVQSGEVFADSLGRLTVEQVKVYRAGSRLELDYSGLLDAGPARAPRHLALALSRNPVAGRAELLLAWPDAGPGSVDLFDVTGRLVRHLWSGPAAQGPPRLPLETANLPGGLYFAVARAAGTQKTQRVIVLR